MRISVRGLSRAVLLCLLLLVPAGALHGQGINPPNLPPDTTEINRKLISEELKKMEESSKQRVSAFGWLLKGWYYVALAVVVLGGGTWAVMRKARAEDRAQDRLICRRTGHPKIIPALPNDPLRQPPKPEGPPQKPAR